MNTFTIIRNGNRVLGNLAPGLTAQAARYMLMTPRRHSPRPWEQEALNSAEWFRLRNGLSAYRWGKGPVVLCLHGWEGRPSQFAAFVPPLVKAGYQVVAIDAPAHGRSPGKQAHPLLFMEALMSAAEELGPISMAIGHSMGAGALALALARGLKVERAVLIAGPESFEKVLNRFGRFMGLPRRAQQRFIDLVARHTNAPMESVDIRQLASQLNTPALIVHDRDDVVTPVEEGGEIARQWPGAKLLVTIGLGHYRVLRSQMVVDAVTRFVRSKPALRLVA